VNHHWSGLVGGVSDLTNLEHSGAAVGNPDGGAEESVSVADALVVLAGEGAVTAVVAITGSDVHLVAAAVHAGGGQGLLGVAALGGGQFDVHLAMSNQVVDVEVSLAAPGGPDRLSALVEAEGLTLDALAPGTVSPQVEAVDVGGVTDVDDVILVAGGLHLLGGVETLGGVVVVHAHTSVIIGVGHHHAP